jgi:hypothetical protein
MTQRTNDKHVPVLVILIIIYIMKPFLQVYANSVVLKELP